MVATIQASTYVTVFIVFMVHNSGPNAGRERGVGV